MCTLFTSMICLSKEICSSFWGSHVVKWCLWLYHKMETLSTKTSCLRLLETYQKSSCHPVVNISFSVWISHLFSLKSAWTDILNLFYFHDILMSETGFLMTKRDWNTIAVDWKAAINTSHSQMLIGKCKRNVWSHTISYNIVKKL